MFLIWGGEIIIIIKKHFKFHISNYEGQSSEKKQCKDFFVGKTFPRLCLYDFFLIFNAITAW